MGEPCLTAYDSRGEFDFISGKINYHGADLTSYGGCSGGGVWQIDHNASDGKKRAVLCGILFYQWLPDDQGIGGLECHGPKSIYKSAATSLAGQ